MEWEGIDDEIQIQRISFLCFSFCSFGKSILNLELNSYLVSILYVCL